MAFGDKGYFILPYDQKVEEAKAIIDYVPEQDEHIVIPKNNCFLNILYKALNSILNYFKYK